MPKDVAHALTHEEKIRYDRQLVLPEIGETGQMHLKKSTVMIAGLGGLGSISAYYLTAAGVGKLKIVDMDRVADHNLNRQILHTTNDIGSRKTDSALSKLTALNPLCRIETVSAPIDEHTMAQMAAGCDLIIDGTDNIETRKIIHREAFKKGIPFIFGGVEGFDGMVATFIPGRSACLECIFPGPAPSAPRTTGVIGPAAGVVASLQSMEALKMLVGRASELSGWLMYFHGNGMRVKKIKIDRNPACRLCGVHRTD